MPQRLSFKEVAKASKVAANKSAEKVYSEPFSLKD